MTAHRDDWAGTGAVVRKPPMKETAMRMCGGLEYPGLDRLHNLKGTERILLNGDLMFCSTFDFNELGTAKIAHRQPLRYEPVDKPQRHEATRLLWTETIASRQTILIQAGCQVDHLPSDCTSS